MQPCWTDSEPGWRVARAELARMHRRVRARWFIAVFATIVLTALIVAYRARTPPSFEASIVVRVIESDFDPDSAPSTSTQLQDYLWEVVLNRPTLIQVIEDNDLYPDKMGFDPGFAVESMREDLDIDVLRNYFSEQRYGEDPPRTARVRIRYAGRSSQHALAAVRDIALLIGEREAHNRERAVEFAAESARATAAGLRNRYVELQAEEIRLRRELRQSPESMTAVIGLQGIQARLGELQRQMREAQQEASLLDLRTELEGQAMGLRFEVVDSGTAQRAMLSQEVKLSILGVVAFLFLLPVVGVSIGAYDLRVYDAEDLRCLGAEAFGHIPAFPGHRIGSMEGRLQAASQVNRDRRKT